VGGCGWGWGGWVGAWVWAWVCFAAVDMLLFLLRGHAVEQRLSSYINNMLVAKISTRSFV
jgi:hypothetical protein